LLSGCRMPLLRLGPLKWKRGSISTSLRLYIVCICEIIIYKCNIDACRFSSFFLYHRILTP
jgi:hypothetical protein